MLRVKYFNKVKEIRLFFVLPGNRRYSGVFDELVSETPRFSLTLFEVLVVLFCFRAIRVGA